MVSGKTKKNSKVILKLNGTEVATVVSDDSGVFTKALTSISQKSNILAASVLDGNNNVIGSVETQFGTAIAAPLYYNLSVLPGLDIEASTGITLTVDAEPALTEVTMSIDGTLLTAREQSPGKYVASTLAPAKSGTYPIQVSLKNVLAQTTVKPAAAVLNIKEKAVLISGFKNVKATVE